MGFLKKLLAPKKQEKGPIKREGRYFLNEEEYQKWKSDCECTDLCEKGLKAQGNGEIEQAIHIPQYRDLCMSSPTADSERETKHGLRSLRAVACMDSRLQIRTY